LAPWTSHFALPGCRGFTGPVPPPLLMRRYSSRPIQLRRMVAQARHNVKPEIRTEGISRQGFTGGAQSGLQGESPSSGADVGVSRCVAPVCISRRTVARQSAARRVWGIGVALERHILRRSWLSWRHGQDGLREGLTRPGTAPRKPTKRNPRHGGEERRTATGLPRNTPARQDSAHRRPCGKQTSLA
jgi:hypothetical protein